MTSYKDHLSKKKYHVSKYNQTYAPKSYTHSEVIGNVLLYKNLPLCIGHRYRNGSRLIRNGKTAAAFSEKDHYEFIEESGIHLDKQGLWDRRDKCLLVTQIITPRRVRRVIERTARTFFNLPENAHVRNIRMTEDNKHERQGQPVKHMNRLVLTLC